MTILLLFCVSRTRSESEIMSEEKAASLNIKGFLLKPIVMKDLA